eukprot:5713938-Pyramimonas_sp.AAC.1
MASLWMLAARAPAAAGGDLDLDLPSPSWPKDARKRSSLNSAPLLLDLGGEEYGSIVAGIVSESVKVSCGSSGVVPETGRGKWRSFWSALWEVPSALS